MWGEERGRVEVGIQEPALAPERRTGRNRRMRRSVLIVAGIMSVAALTAGLLWYWRKRPPSWVTRTEAISIAASYVAHEWTATAANIFHGVDAEGIRVDTPDLAYQPAEGDKGWWQTSGKNVGLPYKWGGFETPEEFDRGLREGRYAGDIYSAEKRRLLDDAISLHAVGIDCSGFVSRCWKLPRSFSTRELPQLCDPVTDLRQLKPGDIFNTHNKHVRLFAGWADAERTRIKVYEAGVRVALNEYVLKAMLDEGYTAWRYHGMSD